MESMTTVAATIVKVAGPVVKGVTSEFYEDTFLLAPLHFSKQVSWNVFRYVGDSLHLIGIAVLLLTVLKNRSTAGFSKSTQYLYFLVFITRYLDLFERSQARYLVIFKLTYIGTATLILLLFHRYDSTYERRTDSCNIVVLIAPCAIISMILTDNYSISEVMWTFSQFLEALAMVPQYVFCYRERKSRSLLSTLYVASLGGYRVFYAFNWIYKKVMLPRYSDVQSWMGGLIEILLFADFICYRYSGRSILRSMVLAVDTKINEISDSVEMKILGSSSLQRIERREAVYSDSQVHHRKGFDADMMV